MPRPRRPPEPIVEPDAAKGVNMLVCHIVWALTGDSIGPKVTMTRAGELVDILIDVERPHLGRVIGKDGRTIAAIRTIAANVGRRQGLRVNVRKCDLPLLPAAE